MVSRRGDHHTATRGKITTDSEQLDIPASIYCQGSDLTLRMLQAKRADLLIHCADGLHTHLLLIADAAGSPQDASRTGHVLAY